MAGEDVTRRRDGLRALFESLPPQEASVLAMLYPGAVGNASGVPFEYRADANTVAVVAAREAEGDQLQDLLDTRKRNQRDDDDLNDQIKNSKSRMALYDSIVETDRQILVFDPADDGAIAELHGDIDSTTKNVGVLVPGTETEMATFEKVADRSESFVASSKGLAMVSWVSGDLPDHAITDAPFPEYAEDLAPRLAGFSHDVRQEINHSASGGQDVQTRFMGHSYGGAVVGLAETHGLDADHVLHVEAAGMGSGVDGPEDLPSSQDDVHRYSMTAPGDFIESTQGVEVGGVGHGADPDDFPGSTRIDTGNKVDGTLNIGGQAHSGVYEVDSDAWQGMLGYLNGGEVQTYREPLYEDTPLLPPPGWIPEQIGWKAPGTRLDIE